MITGHYFKPVQRRSHVRTTAPGVGSQDLANLLRDCIVERFARLTGLEVLWVPLHPRGPEEDEEPPANPAHPACAAFAYSDYCRESWQLHLATLERRRQSHWHECDLGMHCAVIPLVCRGRCLAACKLVCANSMAGDVFEGHAELLDILVRDLATSAADMLARMLPAVQDGMLQKVSAANDDGRWGSACPRHPQVRRAVGYIEEHLRDPSLTVARVARELGIHADYLANLFTRQVGRRTSRYITARRIERAKTLLITTHWPIKRVAHESGFAHPNWFCHVFREQTGCTPSQYRHKSGVGADAEGDASSRMRRAFS